MLADTLLILYIFPPSHKHRISSEDDSLFLEIAIVTLFMRASHVSDPEDQIHVYLLLCIQY